MAPAPVGALVLAAGLAQRFGGPKLHALLRGRPVIGWVLDQVALARDRGLLACAIVVHRADDFEIARLARERGLEPHRNPRPAAGMASSLQLGLNALMAERWQPIEGALVVLGDQPLLRVEVIEQLTNAFDDSLDLVRPRYSADPNIPGHPVIVHRRQWSRALGLTEDEGFRAIVQSSGGSLRDVPVSGANPDVDTPADLARLDEQEGSA